MGALSTIKNNNWISDAKTDAIVRGQILSRGRNGRLFQREREEGKRRQILTSFFEETKPSTETIARQKQSKNDKNFDIEEHPLDSTDLKRTPEPELDSQLNLDTALPSTMEEIPGALLEQKFQRLVDQWHKETLFISSSTEKMMHPAYQKIIGMGPAVVPLLLQELQERGGHWFWALRAITEEDPVEQEDVGRIRKMAEAWLRWGKQKNLL